jgi:hypothetical protein
MEGENMKIAYRVVKVITFLFMVVALGAFVVACDQATPKQGEKGDTGDTGGTGGTGGMGAPGGTGPRGPGALAGKTIRIPAVFITMAGAADTPMELPIDVADYFVGGNRDGREYAMVGDAPTPALRTGVTHEGPEGSTLTISVDDMWTPPTTDDTRDLVFMISAMDTDRQRAQASVSVRDNARPTRSSGSAVQFTVGTSSSAPDEAFGTPPVSCAVDNQCTIDTNGLFEDVNFEDKLTVALDEIGSDDADKLTAIINDAGNIVITGLKATTTAVSLMVAGSDEAGTTATEKVTLTVTVDGAPTIGPIENQSMKVADAAKQVATASDPEGESLDFLVTSSDDNVATGSANSDDEISVESHNAGVATITVAVTESSGGEPSQTTTVSFTVTVTV